MEENTKEVAEMRKPSRGQRNHLSQEHQVLFKARQRVLHERDFQRELRVPGFPKPGTRRGEN